MVSDDLGLDAGVLGDIADLASQAAAAVDQAMGAIDALSALASLADGGLDFAGMLDPLKATTDAMPAIASQFSAATAALGAMFEQ